MPIRVKQSRQQVLRFYCPNIFVAVFSSLPQFILQLFSAVRTIRCRTGGNRGVGRGRNVPLHPFPLKFMLDKLTIEFVPPYQKLYFWTFRRLFVEITKITVEISLLIFPQIFFPFQIKLQTTQFQCLMKFNFMQNYLYSRNKIRKTKNENLIIICQDLICLQF